MENTIRCSAVGTQTVQTFNVKSGFFAEHHSVQEESQYFGEFPSRLIKSNQDSSTQTECFIEADFFEKEQKKSLKESTFNLEKYLTTKEVDTSEKIKSFAQIIEQSVQSLIELLPDSNSYPKSLSLELLPSLVQELSKNYNETLNNREVFKPEHLVADLNEIFSRLDFKNIGCELQNILTLIKNSECGVKIPENNKFTALADIMSAMATKYHDCTVAGAYNIAKFRNDFVRFNELLSQCNNDNDLRELLKLWSANNDGEIIKTHCNGYKRCLTFGERKQWLVNGQTYTMQWEEVLMQNGERYVKTATLNLLMGIEPIYSEPVKIENSKK